MIRMEKIIALAAAAALFSGALKADWKPAGDRIKTEWASKVDPKNPLPEYPRPIMRRDRWLNLNGLWNYAILPNGSARPEKFDGEILVPFPAESSLSGVMKEVGKDKELWYRRTFEVPADWKPNRVRLNFGAVDWLADVWVNGIKIGTHTGGYAPFSFDITNALKDGENVLEVRVWDPTDDSYIPRGKQRKKPGGIFYTPVTGIWQTVWLEPVPADWISDLRITPDLDAKAFKIFAESPSSGRVKVSLLDGGKEVSSAEASANSEFLLKAPNDVKLWSPDSPFLYGLKIDLLSPDSKPVDSVKSYAAMRKISVEKVGGWLRMALNNKPLYHMGPLDQGWWPDGLYTAPTDEALVFDIEKTKELGFNMIRKHVKVEPARWYYHCDRLGMLVWQDMPSGGESPKWSQEHMISPEMEANRRSVQSEQNYRKEWSEIIKAFRSYPCIVVWVPFNEAWGQFKTKDIAEWTKYMDPSRLVNPASGGNFLQCGDIHDIHFYSAPDVRIIDRTRVNVMGEYGGIGLGVKDHYWNPKMKNWGYVKMENIEAVSDRYVSYAKRLLELSKVGICAGVYTQTTDVEGEINGLMTYDRKILKVNPEKIRKANQELVKSLDK